MKRKILHEILAELKILNTSVEVAKMADETLAKYFKNNIREYSIEVSDELFILFTDTLKEKYLLNFNLSVGKFESCSNSLKEKYILRCIRNSWQLPNQLFNWCPDNLKEKFVLKMISNGSIDNFQFTWCSDDLKKRYILSKLNYYFDRNVSMTNSGVLDLFDMCSDDVIKKIIDIIGSKKHAISDFSFRKLSESNKEIYVNHLFCNKFTLTDGQFSFCSDKLKKEYVFKSRNLSEVQIDYLRNNFCFQ